MEGVLTPEIWIAVAEKTKIPELRRTTRDEPDYDKLMRYRIEILDRHDIKLSDIQNVIGTLSPMPGGKEFLDELRSFVQVIILSDTFEQFAQPLMKQLNWPTLFCHRLIVENDRIAGYQLRQPNQKQKSVAALKSLNYHIISAGDSYNDTAMLLEANVGFLIHAPENVKREFPQLKAVESHAELMELIKGAIIDSSPSIEEAERNAIIQMLKETGGSTLEVAKRIGVARQALEDKMKLFKISS